MEKTEISLSSLLALNYYDFEIQIFPLKKVFFAITKKHVFFQSHTDFSEVGDSKAIILLSNII